MLAPFLLVIILEDAECGPVDGVELLCLDVADCGHSEWEDVLLKFVLGVLHGTFFRIELQGLIEVLSAKTTHDHDGVTREL